MRAPITAFASLMVLVASAGCGGPLAEGATVARHGLVAGPIDGMLVGECGGSPLWLGRRVHNAPPGTALANRVRLDGECATIETPVVAVRARFAGSEPVPLGDEGERLLAGLGLTAVEVQAGLVVHYALDIERRMTLGDGARCPVDGGGFGAITDLYHGAATIEVHDGNRRRLALHQQRGWVAARVHVDVAEAAPLSSAVGFAGRPGAQRHVTATEALVDGAVEAAEADSRLRLVPAGETFEIHDAAGPIAENELIRRYRATTGTSELDAGRETDRDADLEEVLGDRNPWIVPVAAPIAVAMAAATALLVYLIAEDDSEVGGGGFTLTFPIVGGAMALITAATSIGAGYYVVTALAGDYYDDGSGRISETDAHILINHHNQAREEP